MHDKFEVGLKLSLQINKSYQRFEVILVGWITNRVIMATSPNLRDTELTSEDHCVIRFLKEGIAYGFHTQMIGIQHLPIPLIFFRYPDDIASLTFRRSERVKINIPAKVMGLNVPGNLISDKATIIDLSETGCLLEMVSDKLSDTRPGRYFYLTASILNEAFELDCTIRNIRRNKANYLLGVEFKNVPQKSTESIQTFLCILAGVCKR